MKTVSGTAQVQKLVRLLTTMLLVGLVASAISLAFRPNLAGAAQSVVAPVSAQASWSGGGNTPEVAYPATVKELITDPVTGKEIWLSTGTVPLSPSFIEEVLAKGQGEDVACPDGKECP